MKNSKNIIFEIQCDLPSIFFAMKHITSGANLHFHRSWEFYCVLDGEVTATINDEKYTLTPGTAILTEGLVPHSYECEHAKICYALIGTDYIKLFCDLYPGKTLPRQMWNKQKNEKILEFVSNIAEKETENSPLEKYADACKLLSMIVSAYGAPDKTTLQKRANSTVYKAITYIYDNYTKDISLATIASYVHLQPQSLSNLLCKYLKTDLRNYINNLRIQHFFLLQRQTNNKDLSVLELAMQCGFSSPTTFYRARKKYLIGTHDITYI